MQNDTYKDQQEATGKHDIAGCPAHQITDHQEKGAGQHQRHSDSSFKGIHKDYSSSGVMSL